MKKYLYLVILITACNLNGQILINEIQPANGGVLSDNKGDYDDWFEIINTGTDTTDIAGLILRDNVDTWVIPSGLTETKLEPNAYIIFWADDEEAEGPLHTNFKLSASNGELLALYDKDGISVIDSVRFPPMSEGNSYGRCGENNSWNVLTVATPNTQNDCSVSVYSSEKNNFATLILTNTGNLRISVQEISLPYSIKISDITGKKVFHENDIFETDHIINKQIQKGLFIVTIYNTEFRFTEKVMH